MCGVAAGLGYRDPGTQFTATVLSPFGYAYSAALVCGRADATHDVADVGSDSGQTVRPLSVDCAR